MKTIKNKMFLLILFVTVTTHAQLVEYLNPDSSKNTQYRRGVELNDNMISYEDKYRGKNLNEEKRRLFPLNSGTAVWTELNPKVPRVDYLGIHFITPDTGWAVGDLGAVIKTTDGGDSWEVSETNTTTPVLKIKSFTEQVVIASGFSGLILRSTDGGETFNQITSGVTGDLWGLQMINDTLGWSCGNGNSLIKTTDGGLTWQTQIIPGYNSDLWWIEFQDENYGFISGNLGQVFKTIDGGESWQIIQTSVNTPLFSLDLIDSLHIAAAGYGGNHVYSSDGGIIWQKTPMYQLPNEDVNCVKYLDADTGYVLTLWNGLYKTTNRGESWQGVHNPVETEYEIQFFSEELVGYKSGTELHIFKSEGDFDVWQKAIINDGFGSVFFTSEQKGFVASGTLYKTTDSGISWESVPGVYGGNLHFIDSLTGFIARSPIYKTIDGGESWYETNIIGVTGNPRKVFFVNSTIGWAITGKEILKTTDGGENWFKQFEMLSGGFTSIYFVDSLYGWSSALGRRPFKTTDGGNNWIEQTNLPFYESDDIIFLNYNTGYFIDTRELYRTIDGGNTWLLHLNSQYIIRSFGWITKDHGFIMGDGVYETVDSGETWTEHLELRNIGLRRFQATENYLGYSTGNLGLIYKYIDSSFVPVELISFNAETINNDVTLTWSTSTETNNSGFEVLKSTDKQNWQCIGFVNGNGTTTLEHHYEFKDNIERTGKHYYKLKQIDFNGEFSFSHVIELNTTKPSSFRLLQNYPNPFNPLTRISFSLAKDSKVTLKIFNVLGEEIMTVIEKDMPAGYYDLDFNASGHPSGVYFYRLKAEGVEGGNFNSIKKMIVIK